MVKNDAGTRRAISPPMGSREPRRASRSSTQCPILQGNQDRAARNAGYVDVTSTVHIHQLISVLERFCVLRR